MFVRHEQVGLLSNYETLWPSLVFSSRAHLPKPQRTRQHHATEFLTSHMERRKGLRTALSWRGNSADLLQHAKCVEVDPVFDGLAICNAGDANSCNGHALAAGWNAHEGALVGAGSRPACHDLVPFGDHVLNGQMGIREGSAISSVVLFEPFWPVNWPSRIVAEIVGGK